MLVKRLLFCFVSELLGRKGGKAMCCDVLMIESVVVNVVYNVNGDIGVNGLHGIMRGIIQ